MNRDDVIRIAKESGAWEYFEIYEDNRLDVPALERFAAAIRSATKEEDARICDDRYEARSANGSPREAASARSLAEAIRASK